MRTTVDLPAVLHHRVLELAHERHQSLSSVVADLTARGLSQLDEPVVLRIDGRSGFPVMSLGQAISSAEVADLLDDE